MLCVCVFFLNFDYRNATHATFIHTKYFCFPSRFLFSYSERNVEKESPKKTNKNRVTRHVMGRRWFFGMVRTYASPSPFSRRVFLFCFFCKRTFKVEKQCIHWKSKCFVKIEKVKFPINWNVQEWEEISFLVSNLYRLRIDIVWEWSRDDPRHWNDVTGCLLLPLPPNSFKFCLFSLEEDRRWENLLFDIPGIPKLPLFLAIKTKKNENGKKLNDGIISHILSLTIFVFGCFHGWTFSSQLGQISAYPNQFSKSIFSCHNFYWKLDFQALKNWIHVRWRNDVLIFILLKKQNKWFYRLF